MPDYMISVRKLKKKGSSKEWSDEFGSGPTQFLCVPDGFNAEFEHVCSRKEWIGHVVETVEKHGGPIIFFINGHQGNAKNTLTMQRQLRTQLHKLGFRGIVIGFDWPAPTGSVHEWDDRDSARDTARRFRDDVISILASQQHKSCDVEVHVLAHGTGAFVLREAMTLADEKQSLKNKFWTCNQIAFIGADISSRSLRSDNNKSASLYRHCHGLTNYQNPFDDALSLAHSKQAPLSERVGRVGLPHHERHRQSINVNCGDHYSVLEENAEQDNPLSSNQFAHDWYMSNAVLLQDFLHCVEGKIDRHYIPTRELRNNELSLYNPESIILLED